MKKNARRTYKKADAVKESLFLADRAYHPDSEWYFEAFKQACRVYQACWDERLEAEEK